MSIVEFLLARIAEDEALARSVIGSSPAAAVGVATLPEPACTHVLKWAPVRVLAECDAKRQVIDRVSQQASYLLNDDLDDDGTEWSEAVHMAADVLVTLVLPYTDHPDYDESWRP